MNPEEFLYRVNRNRRHSRCVSSMEEDPPPIEEEEEPTSEFVGDLELVFGRGKSGYKDVYPLPVPKGVAGKGHRRGQERLQLGRFQR